MLIRLLQGIFCALCAVSSVLAEPAPPVVAVESLSLPQAFRLALAGHPALQQRRSGIDAAELDVKSAEWKWFPTLSVEGSRMVKRPPASAVANSNSNSATVRIDQPLWSGGRLEAEIDVAKIRQQVAELVLVETEQDLLGRVAQVYFDGVRLLDREKIATSNLAEHQRLFDLIKRRNAQGVGSAVDVSLAQARLEQARAELMTFSSGVRTARSSMGQLIGREVRGSLQPVPAPRQVPWSDAEDALTDMRLFSPTLRRLDAEVALADADAAARRAGLMPQLSARYERFDGAAAAVPYDRVMLVLQYQPGAGLASVPAADAALRRAEGARSGAEAGLRDMKERAYTLFNEARSFLEQLEPSREYAAAAGLVMESYLRQYTTTGRKSWIEVMNAQRELAQAAYVSTDVAAGASVAAMKLSILTGMTKRASIVDAGGTAK